MNERITQCVLGAHNRILAEKHIEKESSIDMEIRPRNGITSESIVTLLLDIEDELDIDLDEYLPEIRKCRTIGQLIEIVEMACKK
ncbi:MAG: hypothetical protein J5517_06545 [Eubacterium sp.]|nr:hypothetical protein [Eubacterium sp.]